VNEKNLRQSFEILCEFCSHIFEFLKVIYIKMETWKRGGHFIQKNQRHVSDSTSRGVKIQSQIQLY